MAQLAGGVVDWSLDGQRLTCEVEAAAAGHDDMAVKAIERLASQG